jgi:hypothetical protein
MEEIKTVNAASSIENPTIQQLPIWSIETYQQETKNGIAASSTRRFVIYWEKIIKELASNALNKPDTNSSRPRSLASFDEESSHDDAASSTDSSNSTSTIRASVSSDDCRKAVYERDGWKTLHALPHPNFYEILARHVGGAIVSAETDYEFFDECHGSFNYLRIYSLPTGPSAGKYVVRIPTVGIAAHWREQDPRELRSEFVTLRLIHEQTRCPVSEVIAYDNTVADDLGAPFILMKVCPGV